MMARRQVGASEPWIEPSWGAPVFIFLLLLAFRPTRLRRQIPILRFITTIVKVAEVGFGHQLPGDRVVIELQNSRTGCSNVSRLAIVTIAVAAADVETTGADTTADPTFLFVGRPGKSSRCSTQPRLAGRALECQGRKTGCEPSAGNLV
jgi:hypothetical protein